MSDFDTWYDRLSTTSALPARAPSGQLRRELLLRRLALGALVVMLAAGLSGRLGVHRAEVSAEGDGAELTVAYPQVARPGLASGWQVTVESSTGFDGPVFVAITHRYMQAFDFNNLSPQPASAHVDGDMLVLEFAPPIGRKLTVLVDARLEPGWRAPTRAAVELRGGLAPLRVEFTTWVVP